MNEAVDPIFVSAGVVILSMTSKKLLGENLTDASTLKDIAKLVLAVTGSTMLVSMLTKKCVRSRKTLSKALRRPNSLVLHPCFGWVKTRGSV